MFRLPHPARSHRSSCVAKRALEQTLLHAFWRPARNAGPNTSSPAVSSGIRPQHRQAMGCVPRLAARSKSEGMRIRRDAAAGSKRRLRQQHGGRSQHLLQAKADRKGRRTGSPAVFRCLQWEPFCPVESISSAHSRRHLVRQEDVYRRRGGPYRARGGDAWRRGETGDHG